MIHRDVSEARMLVVTKLIVLGLAALSVPIGIARPGYIMEMMNLAYLIAGSAGGLVILLSMFYRNMTRAGAWAGILSGGVIAIGATVLQYVGVWPEEIDAMIPTVATAFLIILLVSRFTRPNDKMLEVYDRMNQRSSEGISNDVSNKQDEVI
ncbi:proline/sodium symporter PutP [Geomicrobium sp. JCM 19039]|nr:proline/sodium symporter PutP [Geomicrobium sp. JCM 19039]